MLSVADQISCRVVPSGQPPEAEHRHRRWGRESSGGGVMFGGDGFDRGPRSVIVPGPAIGAGLRATVPGEPGRTAACHRPRRHRAVVVPRRSGCTTRANDAFSRGKRARPCAKLPKCRTRAVPSWRVDLTARGRVTEASRTPRRTSRIAPTSSSGIQRPSQPSVVYPPRFDFHLLSVLRSPVRIPRGAGAELDTSCAGA